MRMPQRAPRLELSPKRRDGTPEIAQNCAAQCAADRDDPAWRRLRADDASAHAAAGSDTLGMRIPRCRGSLIGRRMDRCLTCQFFDRHDARDGKTVQWGQCRRNAPALNPLNAKPHMIEGVWPHVRGDDWCGEYKGLAKRLDAQLTELLDDPLIANLAADGTSSPRYVPIGTPRDGSRGSNGN